MPGVPADLLTTNFKTLLQRETGYSVGFLVEFDLKLAPGAAATTVRFADVEASRWGVAHYDGLVKELGTSRRGVPLLTSDLQIPEQRIVLIDTDTDSALGARFWAKLIRGPVSRYVAGSPARVYMHSADLASFSDAFLETNMVINRWDRLSEREIAIYLRPDTFLLERAIPDFVMTEALYPQAKPENWGLFGPMLYGRYDSLPTTRKGLLPAYCVDTVNHRYFCTLGKIGILAVFLDGEPFTDYTVEYQRSGGYDTTEIRLNEADPQNNPIGDQAVTYDATGYTNNAGTLILNPVSQYAHYIRNFGVGSPPGTLWKSGQWLTGTSIMNTGAGTGFQFVADFFTARNEAGAHYFPANGQHRSLDAINEWQTSEVVKAFLMNNGKLELGILDPAERRSDAAYYLREADVSFFRPKEENGLSRKVQAQYHYDPVVNQYTKEVETSDLTVPGNKGTYPHQMPWGPVNEEAQAETFTAPDDV